MLRKIINMKSIFTVMAIFAAGSVAQAADNGDMEQRIKDLESKQTELYHNLSEKKSPLGSSISEKLNFGALVEVEAGYEDNDRDNFIGSDIVLATVELAFDAEINDMTEGHVLLLWEEDEGPIAMDEGTITLKAPYGLNLTLGKMYIPFGVYNSHFISDPYTLELGETNKSTVMLDYTTGPLTVSAGVFNGEKDETNDTDNIDNFYASVNVALNDEAILFGLSYISDIYETDLDIAEVGSGNTVEEEIAGISAYAIIALGDFSIEGEYVAFQDDINPLDLGADVDDTIYGKSPEAFNAEIAYGYSDNLEVALRFETSSHLYDLPEEQFGVALSYSLAENTTLAFEYLEGTYDSDGKNGPVGNLGEERSIVTTQIAIEF